jgi:imidazolonepropionase-like amidohydrolase
MLRLLSSALALCAGGFAQAQLTAITNAELHMTDEDGAIIADGTVLVRDGRIVAVGSDVAVPANARIIDAGGMPVTPGFFAPISAIGLVEIGLDEEGNDSSSDDRRLTASLSAADGFNEDSSVMDITRAGGITRAFTVISNDESLFSGCGMVIAMRTGPEAIMQPCAAQSLTLGGAGAAMSGGSRASAMARARRAFENVESYVDDAQIYRLSEGEERLSPQDARALRPVLEGERLLMVEANSASDIRRVLTMKDRYGLRIAILGGAEAWRVADELAGEDVPVILNPTANLPSDFERIGASEEGAARLAERGIKVAFYDAGTAFTHNARLAPQMAGNAVASGMSYGDAMRAVTLTPAELFGLGDELGTIERGKRADLVIWGGDPFEVTVRPRTVLIDGEDLGIDNRQEKMARRYRDLQRGELPVQYRRP